MYLLGSKSIELLRIFKAYLTVFYTFYNSKYLYSHGLSHLADFPRHMPTSNWDNDLMSGALDSEMIIRNGRSHYESEKSESKCQIACFHDMV